MAFRFFIYSSWDFSVLQGIMIYILHIHTIKLRIKCSVYIEILHFNTNDTFVEKFIANIYTALQLYQLPVYFSLFFPPIQTKTEDKSGKKRRWRLEKSIHQSIFTPSQKQQRALKMLAPHLTRADAPFNKGFDEWNRRNKKEASSSLLHR